MGEKAFLWVGRQARLGKVVIFVTCLPGGGSEAWKLAEGL